jgi:uncharacterized protein Yka (UPF0111/DUF47 family)
MAAANSTQFFLDWARERLGEMDATLASLESKAGELHAESRAAANQFIANLRAQRDAFRASVEKQSQIADVAWARTKARLEGNWASFENQVSQYVENVGKQVEQQQATFELLVAAQLKAWRETVEKVHVAAGQFDAGQQHDIAATVQRIKADAAAAEEKLQKLARAGTEPWSALNAALAETRAAFDRASQMAWSAFK